VFAAVARTEEMLTGMLIGHAMLATMAAMVLVASGGLAGRLLVAVSAAALLLRSRLFVTVRQRVPLVVAGIAGFAVLAGRGGVTGLPGPVGRRASARAVDRGDRGNYSRRPPTPYLGRAADIVDTLMVVSVVPVACAVLGLYGRARGLLG
jgi:hypothetical protein